MIVQFYLHTNYTSFPVYGMYGPHGFYTETLLRAGSLSFWLYVYIFSFSWSIGHLDVLRIVSTESLDLTRFINTLHLGVTVGLIFAWFSYFITFVHKIVSYSTRWSFSS